MPAAGLYKVIAAGRQDAPTKALYATSKLATEGMMQVPGGRIPEPRPCSTAIRAARATVARQRLSGRKIHCSKTPADIMPLYSGLRATTVAANRYILLTPNRAVNRGTPNE
ncbi:hypothetical protein KCP75_06605 [Salmonella enterica subsp. enterica]|nr:hypothetical protein KCP75_06605 [Salmonella enterica subsp. enterica]